VPGNTHAKAWEDWGSLNPMYAILTDPKYRQGDDVASFLQTGEGVEATLAELDRLGLCRRRQSALDFGCGIGRLTWVLARHFDSVEGLDIAQSMVAQARALHRDLNNCRFDVHRGQDLRRYRDDSFDLVLCLLVLQHLPSRDDIVSYLAELTRVVRPGGALVVQLPSKVAEPPPPPSWLTSGGARWHSARILRRLGFPASILYRKFDWVPEMTMTPIEDSTARAVMQNAGGKIVHVSEPDVDRGGTEARTYYVTR
jgi:ubiquinone/menaquinone biosynthesis C-methylase UbiE